MQSKETFLYNPLIQKEASYIMWLAFPGCEAFALSSLGYLWMFKTIDECDDINIERIYSDTEHTKINISDINLLGFSFSFVSS